MDRMNRVNGEYQKREKGTKGMTHGFSSAHTLGCHTQRPIRLLDMKKVRKRTGKDLRGKQREKSNPRNHQ